MAEMSVFKRGTRGLGTVRQRARDGMWEGRISWIVGGKRHYRSVIRKGKREAALALAELRKKFAPGSIYRNEDVTFEVFLRSWLAAQKRQWAPGSYRTQQVYVENHILGSTSRLGRIALRDITVDDIDRFLGDMEAAKVGVQTRASVRRTISSALGYAVAKGRLTANPATSAEKVRVPARSGRKALTLTQASELLKVAKKDPRGSIIAFLLDTGCRLGEAFALSWDDVNLEDGYVDIAYSLSRDAKNRVIRKSTKTRSNARVYLEPETLAMLKAHVTHVNAWEHLIWTTGEGKPLDKDDFRKRIAYPMFKAANLPKGFVIHSLRHTAVSLHLAAGTDPLTVAQRGGWKDTRMIMTIYGHSQQDAQKAAVANVSQAKTKTGYRTVKTFSGFELSVPINTEVAESDEP